MRACISIFEGQRCQELLSARRRHTSIYREIWQRWFTFEGKILFSIAVFHQNVVGNKVVGKCVTCKVAAVDEYASDFTCDTCWCVDFSVHDM